MTESQTRPRGPGSPNWHKSNALKTMRLRPQMNQRLLAKGTWDYALVDALTPEPGGDRRLSHGLGGWHGGRLPAGHRWAGCHCSASSLESSSQHPHILLPLTLTANLLESEGFPQCRITLAAC